MIVAKLLPGIGNPLELTMKQFNGICENLSKESTHTDGSDHRANVEAEMRRIHGSR